MNKNNKCVFILWYNYGGRRFKVLCEYLQCEPFLVKHLIKSRGIFWKLFFWIDYSYKGIVTLFFLTYYKPDIVFAQSPPSLCPIFCSIYCNIFKKKLIVDAHNGAFRKPWIRVPFYTRALEAATIVIVHNYEIKNYLSEVYRNIRFHTLHDRIPEFELSEGNGLSPIEKYFLIITSYDADEPMREIFDAASLILSKNQHDISFLVTGDYNKNIDLYHKYHRVDGIEFLGFIDDTEYGKLLVHAYGVIALSTLPMVQQCAAMEAMGADVPVIVTDSKTNRRLFYKGALFTNPDSQSITKSIDEFMKKRPTLRTGMEEIKSQLHKEWDRDFAELNEIINYN